MTVNQLDKKSFLKEIFTKQIIIRLVAVWLVVILFELWGDFFLGGDITPIKATVAFIVLLATIIGAAFGVVKEADALAEKLGEPFGTLILTLSIVSIEVILIAAVMIGPGEVATIGKDSIFSVMMIIMNLVLGICILTGGLKYKEQEYNAQGTMSYIAMIITLGGLSMILPNFIVGGGNGTFTTVQAIVLSVLFIFLYGCFLAFQTKNYSHLYVQPKSGMMEIPYSERSLFLKNLSDPENGDKETNRIEIIIRSVILIAMILPIVLLSHSMAIVVDYGIMAANLPPQLGGVLIAIIVFTPESITSVKAALHNEFQRAINLCHGAFVSTIGITVPCVLIIGLIADKTVLMGLTASETMLFLITTLLSLMTFAGKRTTPFLGIMHLAVFVVFALLIFVP